MSILGSIISKIFHAANQITTQVPAASAAIGANVSPGGGPAPQSQPQQQTAASGAIPADAPLAQVDVHSVLTGLAAKKNETLNWQTSIVDLLKLLDLDSSLEARKQLAKELDYTGNTADSASMNVWLHAQVIAKLAENGGKVPDSLKAA